MTKKVEQPKLVYKKFAVNLFGLLGYCVVSLQLLIVMMAYFKPIQTLLYSSIPEPQPASPVLLEQTSEPSALSIILGLLIVVAMVGLTIYVFLKTPMVIAKTSKKIVNKTTDTATPFILHVQKKKDTKKNRQKLSVNLIIGIKLVLVIAPLLAVSLSPLLVEAYLDTAVALVASVSLASLSLACFVIQYVLMFVLKLDRKYFW